MKREAIKIFFSTFVGLLIILLVFFSTYGKPAHLCAAISTGTIVAALLYFKLDDLKWFEAIDASKDELLKKLQKNKDPYTVSQYKPKGKHRNNYYLRHSIMTECENSIFQSIRQVLPSEYLIAPKVHLCDIFGEQQGFKDYRGYTLRRHFDFLIIQKDNLRPAFAIELDDPSHDNPHTQKRDEFKDEISYSCGLPLIRIGVKEEYSLLDLEKLITKEIKKVS